MIHIADNHDALLDYLYEEGDPAERLTIAKHLQECAACAVAVLEFQNVRGMLRDWTPPASPSLNAPVTSPNVPVTSPSATVDQGARGGWWRGWGPATTKESLRGWGLTTRALLQATAAILIFASGMAVSQLHVDYQDGALTVHARPHAPVMPAASSRVESITPSPRNANPGAATVSVPDGDRARLEPQSTQNASSAEIERLLQRVRTMIDQSEQRQQRELALRLSQVAREVDTQHQADLMRIQQDFGQQQEATMDYLVRTSGGVK